MLPAADSATEVASFPNALMEGSVSNGIIESQSSQSQEQPSQQQGTSRSKLVQRLLAASSSLPAFVNDLLTTQAVVVAGTEAAAFLIEKQPEQSPENPAGLFSLRPIAHIRPDQSGAEQRAAAIAAFQEIIKPCVIQGKDGAVEIGSPDEVSEPQYCLVTLLRNEGNVVAVSAVVTRCRDLERARQRLISMQLVAGYFELYSLRRGAEQSRVVAQSHQHVLQLATAVATAEGFDSAAMNLCNELATRTGAARVSIGWKKGRNVKVKALSNTEKFDKKQELIVQLEKVMEECFDQEEIVQYDPAGTTSSQNVTRAAAEFSRLQGGHIVMSLPLRKRADLVGVATLEFASQAQLSQQAATGLAIAVDLLAPQLYDRYMNDRFLVTKAGISIKEGSKKVLGRQHTLAKVLVLAGIVAALVLFNVPYLVAPADVKPYVDCRMTYHVSAPFQFVPLAKHTLTAPYEGHLWSLEKIDGQLVAPGMWVREGQLLATLRTTELKLKLAQALADMKTKQIEADAARNATPQPKVAEAQIAMAKYAQSKAQAELLQAQIDQAQIRAPRDGQILNGDLRDKIGSPVKAGEALFEIADPSQLQVEMSVEDIDVKNLHVYEAGQNWPGSSGYLATRAMPLSKYPFVIERIVPNGEPRAETNVFKVYAKVDTTRTEPSASWAPGQLGDAKVDINKRTIWSVWTGSVSDFLRLKFWSWHWTR